MSIPLTGISASHRHKLLLKNIVNIYFKKNSFHYYFSLELKLILMLNRNMRDKNGFAVIEISLILFLILALAAFVFIFYKNNDLPTPPTPTPNARPTTSENPTPTIDTTNDWLLYTNTTYNYSFHYPTDFYLNASSTSPTVRVNSWGDTNPPLIIEPTPLPTEYTSVEFVWSGDLTANQTLIDYINENVMGPGLSDNGPFTGMTVGNTSGYRSEQTQTIYFLSTSHVIYINTYNNNDIANRIVETVTVSSLTN